MYFKLDSVKLDSARRSRLVVELRFGEWLRETTPDGLTIYGRAWAAAGIACVVKSWSGAPPVPGSHARAQVCSPSRISVYEGVMPVGSRLTVKVRGPAGMFGFRVPAALCQ